MVQDSQKWLDSSKPSIELNGKPILQHVINNLATENSNITIILQEEHTKNYQNFLTLKL